MVDIEDIYCKYRISHNQDQLFFYYFNFFKINTSRFLVGNQNKQKYCRVYGSYFGVVSVITDSKHSILRLMLCLLGLFFLLFVTDDLLFLSCVIRLEIETFRLQAKNLSFAHVCKETRGEKGPK